MPGNTDAGWPRLTARYQTNIAEGRDSYERFWGQMSSVSVSDVQGQPRGGAVATVRYVFKDGHVEVERTAYRLVVQGGRMKIDDSTVLSRG
jgi:eukaryotic-like serine/threonine-protein kinase